MIGLIFEAPLVNFELLLDFNSVLFPLIVYRDCYLKNIEASVTKTLYCTNSYLYLTIPVVAHFFYLLLQKPLSVPLW